MNTEKLELWCILELFGHQQIAGKITEFNMGSDTHIRIDIPATKTNVAFSRILNPKAIYATNPVTEELARQKAEDLTVAPIQSWDIREMYKRLELNTGVQVPVENNTYNDFDDEDEYNDYEKGNYDDCGDEA